MLILAVGGQGGFAWQRYELKTKFADVKGLKSGAVVRVAGVEVGKVTDVGLVGSEVEVTLEVNEENQQRITTESRASIGSLSLLGEPVIDITPSTQGTPLKDGEFLPAGRAAGQLSDVAESATQSLEQLAGILSDIRAGKGTVGKLFTDDAVYKEVQGLVASAEIVAGNLSRGEGTLGMLIRDPAAYRSFNAALADLQTMTRRVNAGEGSLGRLLNDDALARSLTSATRQCRPDHGALEQRRGHRRKASDRQGALRAFQHARGAHRQADRQPRERPGNGRVNCCKTSSYMRTLMPLRMSCVSSLARFARIRKNT